MASDILRPTIEYHGPFATHNMPCAVCRQRPAVLQINDDVFMPCWECRERWELRPRSWWSRLFRRPARNAGEGGVVEVTHAYIGRCRGCEAVLAMCVDDPKDTKLAAEFLAENAEAGLVMSRLTLEEARAAWSATWKDNVGCKCPKPPARNAGEVDRG